MSLTRAYLKGLGLDDEKVNAIIDAHSETVTALKNKYTELETQFASAKESADKLPEIQKELESLKKEDYKSRYETEKAAHDQLKATVESGRVRAAKEKAVRAWYEKNNIRDAGLAIAMRGTRLDELELNEDGSLRDAAPLERLLEGDFKPLVTQNHRTVSSGGSLAGREETPPSANETMNRLLRASR